MKTSFPLKKNEYNENAIFAYINQACLPAHM